MKTKLKRVVQAVMAAGLMVLGLGLVQQAQALKNPDTLKVYVTPNVTYAVAITSPTVNHPGYDFGQVDLTASTISTLAVAVANTGNVSEFWALSVGNTPEDGWSPLAADGATGNKTFELLAHFVATGAGQPADASFDGSKDIVNGTPISSSGNTNTNFGLGGLILPTGGTATRDMYLKLKMPASIGVAGQQSMVVTINGQNN